MRVSGSVTRPIGLDLSDSSPVSVALIALPASTPSRSRVPVPLLPRSSGLLEAVKPSNPTPWTTISPPSGGSTPMPAPRHRSAAAVDAASPA
jgi:hypothetical protein